MEIGKWRHLRHHSVKTASFEISEVSKLSVDIIPCKKIIVAVGKAEYLVVTGSVIAQWCRVSWSWYITHWVSST